MDYGIKVYVMIVVLEEFVCMVVFDFKYGYNVLVENVIGVIMFFVNKLLFLMFMIVCK